MIKKALILIAVAILSLTGVASATQSPIADYNVGEPFEPNYRNFANNAFATIDSLHSGGSAPAYASPYSLWADTSTGTLKQLMPSGYSILGTLGGPFAPSGMAIISLVNDGTTGTTLNKLTKLTGSGQAIITATSDTAGAIGLTIAGAGTTSNATVQLSGLGQCVFDGATTAYDYVGISSSAGGDCHDIGSSYPSNAQAIGRVLTTNGGAGTYPVVIFGGAYAAAVALTATGPVSITGTQTNGADAIHHVNWDNVIDPIAYGCKGYLLTKDSTITTTNGSTTITASDSPFTSTMCQGGSGCTGTSGNWVARIENIGQGTYNPVTTWTGTVTAFTNANQITISSAYPSINGGGGSETNDEIVLQPNDNTCVSNIIASGGSSAGRSLNVMDTVPIGITTGQTFLNTTGDWWCNGMGANQQGPASVQGGLIWYGTTADQYMLTAQDSWGFRLHSCPVIGATNAPPLAGVRFYNSIGGQHPNAFNEWDHVAVGGFGVLNFGINDNGGGGVSAKMTADHNAGDTSITVNTVTNLVSGFPSALGGLNALGPGAPLIVLDNTGGREVAITSLSYVRGANPIVLATGLGAAHAAANTTLIWAVPATTYGFLWDWQGTQDDRNNCVYCSARNTAAGIMAGSGLITAQIEHPNTNGSMIGVVANGHMQIDSPQWDNTCFARVGLNGVEYNETNPARQSGSSDVCGPAGGINLAGLDLELLCNDTNLISSGAAGCGSVHILGGNLNLGANTQSDGTMIDLGISASTIEWDHGYVVNNQVGGAPAGVNPAIHYYGSLNTKRTIVSYRTNDRTRHMTVVDNGGIDNRSIREYDIQQEGLSTADALWRTRKILRGSQTWTDAPNLLSEYGDKALTGIFSLGPLASAQAPFSCTCATSGAQTWFYKIAWSIGGILQPVGAEASVASCAATVNSTNTVTCSTFPVLGADQVCYYRGASSGAEALAGCVAVGNSPDTSHGETTFVDTNSSPSGTPPSSDGTGLASAVMFQPGIETVAAAPACDAAHDGAETFLKCSGACSAGGTCSAGTAHVCRVGCNGSGPAWVEDGFQLR